MEERGGGGGGKAWLHQPAKSWNVGENNKWQRTHYRERRAVPNGLRRGLVNFDMDIRMARIMSAAGGSGPGRSGYLVMH